MASKRSGKKRMLAMLGAAQVRREHFSGLPIVDADADFTLLVSTENVVAAKGHEKDFGNCVLAKACAQQVGASVVAFFRMTAYLELPDENGVRRVVRFLLDKHAAAIIAAFDSGKTVRGNVTVKLRAPTSSNTLDAIRRQTKKSKDKRRHAELMGTITGELPSESVFHKKPRIADMDVRNGSGLVHNTLKTEAKPKPKRRKAS